MSMISEPAQFPEELQAVFDEAAGQWNGIDMKGCALLGTQVAAGLNYRFLGESTVDDKTTYYVMTVYQDLLGNIELTDVTEFAAAEAEADKALAGGWMAAEATYAAGNSEYEKILAKGCEKLTGVKYQLIACLETQIVAGTNYRFLCMAEAVTADPQNYPAVLTVYEDTEGNISVTDITVLSLAALGN